jgi:hypothetical protein
MHVHWKLDLGKSTMELVHGFKRIWTTEESVAINVQWIRYRPDSSAAKYFWWHNRGHQPCCNFDSVNDYKYWCSIYSDQPGVILLARRCDWLLHIEWEQHPNDLYLFKNRCQWCAVFRRSGPLAQGVAIGKLSISR